VPLACILLPQLQRPLEGCVLREEPGGAVLELLNAIDLSLQINNLLLELSDPEVLRLKVRRKVSDPRLTGIDLGKQGLVLLELLFEMLLPRPQAVAKLGVVGLELAQLTLSVVVQDGLKLPGVFDHEFLDRIENNRVGWEFHDNFRGGLSDSQI
jgi:hypothetical protein